MTMDIYSSLLFAKKNKQKQFAVLIDPDKMPSVESIAISADSGVDYFLIGGSILTNGNLHDCIQFVKSVTNIPVILFPGNVLQIDASADALLFLSLISGRNPEMLIGKHVIAATMTDDFLAFSLTKGNDLITAAPQHNFPGLKAGDCWCLCASRWKEAMDAGFAPPIVLAATHEAALKYVPLDVLREHAIHVG